MRGAITDCGACRGKTVQEGLCPFIRRTGKITGAVFCAETVQEGPGFGCQMPADLEHQVMFEAVAEIVHAFGQVAGKQAACGLQQPVAHVAGQEGDTFGQPVETVLERKQHGQAARADGAYDQERVLAIFLGNVEGVAVDVFARDRQFGK